MSARPGQWELLGYDSDPVPGDPHEVFSEGIHYRGVADTVQQQILRLQQLAESDVALKGHYAEELTECCSDLADHLGKIEDRFRTTGEELLKYEDDLETARTGTKRALDDAEAAKQQMDANAPPPTARRRGAHPGGEGRRGGAGEPLLGRIHRTQRREVRRIERDVHVRRPRGGSGEGHPRCLGRRHEGQHLGQVQGRRRLHRRRARHDRRRSRLDRHRAGDRGAVRPRPEPARDRRDPAGRGPADTHVARDDRQRVMARRRLRRRRSADPRHRDHRRGGRQGRSGGDLGDRWQDCGQPCVRPGALTCFLQRWAWPHRPHAQPPAEEVLHHSPDQHAHGVRRRLPGDDPASAADAHPHRDVQGWSGRQPGRAVGLAGHEDRERRHVGDILASTARLHPSPLHLFVLRWREVSEVPLALFFGLVDPADEPDLAGQWLDAGDTATVEPPVIDELDAPDGLSLRRSLVYSLDEDGVVVVGIRYVVSTGNPDGIVLAHAASHAPADILSALDDIEALLRTVRITDIPQDQP